MALNHPQYQNIRLYPDYNIPRHAKRDVIFGRVVSMLSKVIIFTGKQHFHTPSTLGVHVAFLTVLADFQSQNGLGRNVAIKYVNPARGSRQPLLLVNKTCNIEENTRRVQGMEREQSGSRNLLTSEELKATWTRSNLLSFGNQESLDLDFTQRSPLEAARVPRDYGSVWGRWF